MYKDENQIVRFYFERKEEEEEIKSIRNCECVYYHSTVYDSFKNAFVHI